MSCHVFGVSRETEESLTPRDSLLEDQDKESSSAFQLVPLSDIPVELSPTALVAAGSNLLIGTGDGRVIRFSLVTSDDLDHELFQAQFLSSVQIKAERSCRKSLFFGRASPKAARTISAMKLSQAMNSLFVLFDGILQFYSVGNMQYLGTISPESGKQIQCFDIRDTASSVRVCCTTKRRVHLLKYDLEDDTSLAASLEYQFLSENDLFIPADVLAISWIGPERICLGFSTEYVILDTVSYQARKLCGIPGSILRPLMAADDQTLILALCEKIAVYSIKQAESIVKLKSVRLKETPRELALTQGFVLGILKDRVQFQKIHKEISKKKRLRFIQAQQIEIECPKLMCYDYFHDHIFLVSSKGLWFVQPIELLLKVRDCMIRDNLKKCLESSQPPKDKTEPSLLAETTLHLQSTLQNVQHPFGFSIYNFSKALSERMSSHFSFIQAISPKSFAEYCRFVRKFISDMQERVLKTWPELSWRRDLEQEARYFIEDQILDSVYDDIMFFVFEPEASVSENILAERQTTLKSFFLKDFGSDLHIECISQEEVFASVLHGIDDFIESRTVNAKLKFLEDVHVGINTIVQNVWSDLQEGLHFISADDLISILCFIISRSPSTLPRHVHFLSEFIPPEKLRGQLGYYLTSLQLALQYILESSFDTGADLAEDVTKSVKSVNEAVLIDKQSQLQNTRETEWKDSGTLDLGEDFAVSTPVSGSLEETQFLSKHIFIEQKADMGDVK